MEDKIAVVLAGGIGKRFWPLSVYKPFVNFLGKPLIFHNLELLKTAGINKVILIVPPETEAFTLPEISGLEIKTVIQKAPLGMADALLSAEKEVRGRSILVTNASDVVGESLYQKIGRRIKENTMFTVGKETKVYHDVGYLRLENNKVVGISEKPGEGNEPSKYINLVFDFFPDPSGFFATLKNVSSSKDDAYEQAYSTILKTVPAEMIDYDGFWQPLKYPWHILDIMDYFLKNNLTEHRGRNVKIHDNVFIEGPVWLGDNVRIFENTKIVGPAFVGDNTVIGNNNVIRYSQLGDNCVTGFNTDITRSFIGSNSWFHSNYVGDSVIEGNVSLGSGTVLANLRLDEGEVCSLVKDKKLNTGRNKLGAIIGQDTRIGVNTSVMPGVKIGKNSLVAAGIIIDRDVAEDSFCLGKSELKIEKNTSSVANKTREEFRRRF